MHERACVGSSIVRARALLLALLLIPLNSYWVLFMQVGWNLGYPTMLSLFFNVVFLLFLLVLANRLLLRVAPRHALTPNELLALYAVLAISTATTQFVEYLVPVVAGPTYLAQPAAEGFLRPGTPLARWLTVGETESLRALATGGSNVLEHLPIWLPPFLGWTLFILLLLFTTLCVTSLFYRHWTESERLSFPIVQIPVQMAAAGGAALRGPLFWLGFGIAGGMVCWNGLAALVPWVPGLPIKRQIAMDLSTASMPWNALGILYYSLHPFAIGLGYFLPLDLTFSLGACHWLQQGLRLGAAAFGYGADNPRFPYTEYQAFGAWATLFGFAVWFARPHLRRVLREVKAAPERGEGSGWPLSYRASLLGVLAGFWALSGFAQALGMTFWSAAVFFAFYFMVVTAMARARAELGPPAVDLFYTVPGKVMVALFGARLLGPQTLFSLSLFYWLTLEYPWHPMGHQLEALRIADRQRLRSPSLVLWGTMAAALFAWAVAFLIVLHLDYTLGAATARQPGQTQVFYAREAAAGVRAWSAETLHPDRGAILAMGAGGLVTALLTGARLRITGWPLHPVGYALVAGFTTSYLWLPLWISYLIKGTIVRYGGLYSYRRGMPFFLGLILGEFITGSVWAALSVAVGQQLYVFWPY